MTDQAREVDMMREALRSAASRARPTRECPAPDRFWAALRRELPSSQVRDLVDHTVTCPSCAQAWRLAREVAEGLGPATERQRERTRWTWGALAAVATLLIAVAIPLFRMALGPGTPAYRDTEDAAVRSLLDEAVPLPPDRCVLRWTRGPSGCRYDIQVTTEALVPVARAEALASPEFKVQASALIGLPPGTRLLWRVETILEDGTRVSSVTFLTTLQK